MQRLGLLHKCDIPVEDLLENTDWVNDFIQNQIEQLAGYFQPYLAPAGTLIMKEHESTDYFCLICEGSVDVVKENASGRLKQLKTLGANKIIGEMAFFDRCPSSASVIAREPSTLLVMDEQSFEKLSSLFPYIAMKITIKLIKTISSRLRETDGRLMDLL
ncbi:hypothetical protein AQUSIP_24020 [Aquicella siphonis]|uniref:Cyclic nucleotide-binding domain-containing protein n=1 Tax=Aquicella siphonis TaxID=254247 RepID=A0A5E4PKK0_9COXI|nr:cyclic nucleotide-binding domain-containing protein [Aquicella siphonis]VVC77075.1 hypothetical protein AQUSIP_24020 [Aquicella siphonis]